jgi:hypothetical protein
VVWKTGMMDYIQKSDRRNTAEKLLCNEPEAQNIGFYYSEESY